GSRGGLLGFLSLGVGGTLLSSAGGSLTRGGELIGLGRPGRLDFGMRRRFAAGGTSGHRRGLQTHHGRYLKRIHKKVRLLRPITRRLLPCNVRYDSSCGQMSRTQRFDPISHPPNTSKIALGLLDFLLWLG